MRSRQPRERTAGQDRDDRAAVPSGPAPPARLLALQRAAGNRAVAGLLTGAVVQRSISHQPAGKKAQKVSWAKVSQWPAVAKADGLVAEVIRVVAESKKIHLTVKDGADLVRQATALAGKPDTALVNAADTLLLLQRLLNLWALNGHPVTALGAVIEQRTDDLSGVDNRITGSGLTITMPVTHKGYSTPAGLVGAPANPKGRDQGKFKSVAHSTPLRSKTTSSVNAHLLGELHKQGQLRAIGTSGGTLQICPTCGVDNFLESFEVDHQVAFADIKQTFFDVAEEMTGNPKLLQQVRKKNAKAFTRCFTVTKAKGKGKKTSTVVTATAEALHVFSNDVDNLMRICRTCNGAFGKSDMNYLKWYRENPLFGPHFVNEHLCDDSGLLMPRAKGGGGWGQAARKWFNTHYYPILKDVFELRELIEAGRTSMIREASRRVAAERTSDPTRKRKYREEAKQDRYSNRVLVGSARVLTKAHTDPGRAPMRSGSPERQVKGVGTFLENYERDRKRRRTEETTDYQRGHQDGKAGLKQAKKTTPDYRKGHADGVAAAGEDRDTGYEHGVTGLASAHPVGALPTYDEGFQQGTQRRWDVYDAGVRDGEADDDADTGIAKPTEVGYASLLVLYMESYNEGRPNRV
ncbi:hypothetical protein [Saccharothrix xinjiangensis]|uniref:Uncharacterized protein n=1 Tax=Saccharothrix xinjiangensis TaxID=204798 RepID=A0ABV9Y444_9PSEU